MIAPMRRAVQRAGLSLVLCLAALAAALLAHLILSAAHTQVAHHHHGPGPGQSGISVAVAGSPRERVPERCPAPDPPEHDHSLCGAATVAPATEARPLSSGPFTGLPVMASPQAAPAPTTRRARPVHALPGTTVLISKSVFRI
ncbi:hypothetical protein [Streptosporangium sp. NPDC020145]|uniref:Uncharacterized protein n=1 Tax=Streptosporangium jomthongense TaxID=1193683 RepID=A0ABV8ETN2_9ACTN